MPETPEQLAAGLHQDPRTGQWLFAVPGMKGKQTVETTKNIVVETLLAVLKAKDMLPDPKTAIKFIGFVTGKHLALAAVTIVIGQLFDTATMSVLNIMSDAHMRAALRELQFAQNEPTLRGKRHHRTLADGHIGTAYEVVATKLGKLERQWLKWSDSVAKSHLQASYVALLKAYISYEAGLAAASQWVDTAWAHHAKYEADEVDPERRRLDYMEKTLVELRASTRWFVTHPTKTTAEGDPYHTFRRTAIRDLEKALPDQRYKVADFNRRHQQFRELCEGLKRRAVS